MREMREMSEIGMENAGSNVPSLSLSLCAFPKTLQALYFCVSLCFVALFHSFNAQSNSYQGEGTTFDFVSTRQNQEMNEIIKKGGRVLIPKSCFGSNNGKQTQCNTSQVFQMGKQPKGNFFEDFEMLCSTVTEGKSCLRAHLVKLPKYPLCITTQKISPFPHQIQMS